MTFNQLRTFLEVARGSSVAEAAAVLMVTEPSVSAAVGALRRELGVDLVEREGRGIRLTPAGRELARHAARILGLADRARRSVLEAAGGPGHLRVVGVTTAGEYLLPPLIAAFRAGAPGVAVTLEVGNRAMAFARVLDDEADIAIGGRPPRDESLTGEAFLDNELVIVASAGHGLAGGRSASAARLSEETWLLREPGSGTRETTDEFLAEAGIEPPSIMTVGSNAAIKQAARVGLGITLMSLHAVSDELADGSLVRIPARGTPLRRSWHLLHRSDGQLPEAARRFIAFLRSPAAAEAVVSPVARRFAGAGSVT